MDSEDSKPVVKKEVDSNKSFVSKKVLTSKSKVTKVKKEDNDDDFPIGRRTSNSKEVKKKKKIIVKEEENKNKRKKEKKVYDLPGQKRDPPEEKDPLRIFYETLFKQVPSSEMSQIWLMESGLLPKDVAKKVFEKKKKVPQKLTSPVKSVSAVKNNTKSVSVTVKKKGPASPVSSVKKKTTTTNSTSNQSKKRKVKDLSSEDDDDTNSSDDEFILSSVAKKRKMS